MNKKLDLSTLNKEQFKATVTVDGPVLVLAGAGSGKTRVLTYRIAYLIAKGLALPAEILAVTFTNKAAGEMKERISHLLNSDDDSQRQYLPWMGTFHSICVKILRKDGFRVGLEQNFSIYDSADQLDATKEAMKQLNMSTKEFNPRAIHSYISSAKNELITHEEYAAAADGYFQNAVAKVYPKYQQILQENNSVDFDDLLMYTVQLFSKYPDTLAEYQTKFKYILVDEYQDTNHAQYKIVTMLAAKHHNICVVGDDDQSIYAFRGATIRNILNFEKDYPNAEVVKLEQNYRSTKTILEAAYDVVSKNKNRTDKKLWTDNNDGDKITIYTAHDEKDEAKWAVQQIKELTASQGVSLLETAILYRTNAQSRTLEEELLRQAIPYKIVGGYRFYERKEIKDIISFLQLLYNPDNDAALARVINVPKRGIGAKTQEGLWQEAQSQGYFPFHYLIEFTDKLTHKGLKQFALVMHDLLKASEDMAVAELINFILDRTGYLASLKDGSTENENRIENLKELLSVASKYDDLEAQAGLRAFLEEVALLEGNPDTDDELTEFVTLMTVHAAKGLEFEHVFLVGMEEGLFPHSRVFNEPKELEEERRLAYVAITRAKHNLYIVHADSRLYFGSRQQNMPSRFMEDISNDYIERLNRNSSSGFSDGWDIDFGENEWELEFEPLDVEPGMKVKHDYFGKGVVIDFNEATIRINFGGAFGIKELARDLAQLQQVK